MIYLNVNKVPIIHYENIPRIFSILINIFLNIPLIHSILKNINSPFPPSHPQELITDGPWVHKTTCEY